MDRCGQPADDEFESDRHLGNVQEGGGNAGAMDSFDHQAVSTTIHPKADNTKIIKAEGWRMGAPFFPAGSGRGPRAARAATGQATCSPAGLLGPPRERPAWRAWCGWCGWLIGRRRLGSRLRLAACAHPQQPDDQDIQRDERLPQVFVGKVEHIRIPLPQVEQADHTHHVQRRHRHKACHPTEAPVATAVLS